jgi:hypothetical protein
LGGLLLVVFEEVLVVVVLPADVVVLVVLLVDAVLPAVPLTVSLPDRDESAGVEGDAPDDEVPFAAAGARCVLASVVPSPTPGPVARAVPAWLDAPCRPWPFALGVTVTVTGSDAPPREHPASSRVPTAHPPRSAARIDRPVVRMSSPFVCSRARHGSGTGTNSCCR